MENPKNYKILKNLKKSKRKKPHPRQKRSERVAVLKQGKIITTGPFNEILKDRVLLRSCSLDISIYESVCKKIFF
ncbi:MAG: hypothetical protein ACOC5S_05385 [Acidobacteriota bacterium]